MAPAPAPAGSAGWAGQPVHNRPAQHQRTVTLYSHNSYSANKKSFEKNRPVLKSVRSRTFWFIMPFTGFPEDQAEDGQRLTSSSNKLKLSTNRRQKEKLMLAAANQKARSVIECSGDLEMLPSEARLSSSPPTSSKVPSSAVKLKIAGQIY